MDGWRGVGGAKRVSGIGLGLNGCKGDKGEGAAVSERRVLKFYCGYYQVVSPVPFFTLHQFSHSVESTSSSSWKTKRTHMQPERVIQLHLKDANHLLFNLIQF